MKTNFVAKKRKPNWSAKEMTALAEATTARMKLLKVKFSTLAHIIEEAGIMERDC